MAESKALAIPDSLEPAIMGIGKLDVEQVDPALIAAEFAGRLNGATSEDDIFGEDAPLGADDLLGVPIFISNVRWAPSTKEGDGPTCYAIIGGRRADDGEDVLITCGGQKVQLRLLAAVRNGLLPLKGAKVFTSTKTANGNTVLDLVNA